MNCLKKLNRFQYTVRNLIPFNYLTNEYSMLRIINMSIIDFFTTAAYANKDYMLPTFKIDGQNVIMYNKVICHHYTCHRNLQPTVFLVKMK